MNKFVKGAKNLAFALSFVTVAACGNVKKADLEALEKKIDDKFAGKTGDGKVSEGQGYVRKSELKKVSDEVEGKIDGEIQKMKADVSDLVGGVKKEVLLGALGVDFSNLGGVAKVKGCEGVLAGFEFKGGFKSNEIKIVGKVNKDGFKKEIGSSSAIDCDDEFFKNFVKCGGKIVLEGVENCVITAVSSNAKLNINNQGNIIVKEFCKVFAFWKLCGVLESVKALKFDSAFNVAKRFGMVDCDLSKSESESIINAIADDNSIKYDESAKSGNDLIVASFTIGGKSYSWDIAKV